MQCILKWCTVQQPVWNSRNSSEEQRISQITEFFNNAFHISVTPLAGEQCFVGSCETMGKQKCQEQCKTSRVMTLDESSSYRPNEAWFTGVLSLLLLVIMRVRLLGHSALITLIRSRGREGKNRVSSQKKSLFILLLVVGFVVWISDTLNASCGFRLILLCITN